MSAFFTVVQYVPDPVRDERINIGVIVFGDGHVKSRFVDNWNRVRAFGEESINYVLKFANEADRLDEATIRRIAATWHHSMQLTQPAGSLLSPDKLLVDVANRYLRDWTCQGKPYRGRLKAVTLARSTVREAVASLLGPKAKRLVKNNLLLRGPHGDHEFDVGAENGRPYFAARALSFEGPESGALLRQIESTAWTLEDVREEDKEVPLAVVVLPPKNDHSELFRQAVQIFDKFEAAVVEESALPRWAGSMAEVVAQGWHGSGENDS
jgi:hypothetical protein